MPETKYILHQGQFFKYRLIHRSEAGLLWQVEIELPAVDVIAGVVKMSDREGFSFYPNQTFPQFLSLERVKCLAQFLELVNDEQNKLDGISKTTAV